MAVRIALAQYPITYHHTPDAWCEHTGQWVREAVKDQARLLVFPEYGAMELVSLFPGAVRSDLHAQLAEMERWREYFLQVFAELAGKYALEIVTPSFPVEEAGRKVNRIYVVNTNGVAGYQDKIFMTRFENEEWGISPGKKELTLFEADWGKFGIQVCYDVEFSIGAQQLAAAGAQLVVAPSCTETTRGANRVHTGARARALENQIYVAVSQTVGDAAWSPAVDRNYGYAAIYSTSDRGMPDDGVVAMGTPQKPGWLIRELEPALLEEVRQSGEVFNFKDQQRIVSQLAETPLTVVKVTV